MAAPAVSPTPYIQAVAPWLPANYPLKLQSLCQSSEDVLILEVVLRFLCGGDCPPDAAPRVRQEWAEKQRAVMTSIQALRGPAPRPEKRKDEGSPLTNVPKKPRLPNGTGHAALNPTSPHPVAPLEVGHALQQLQTQQQQQLPPLTLPLQQTPSPQQTFKVSPESPTPHLGPPIATDERPCFTLHAISVTSPVRKKVDITIGQSSIQMLHPTTGAIEATLDVAIFTRAFILPTRGKSKPHWTVVIAAQDEPGRAQVIFGVDAMSPPGYKTTEYEPPYRSTTHHPRNTPTIPSLRAFLRHVPNLRPPGAPLEPTTAVFRSAVQPAAFNATSTQPSPDRPEGVPGAEAYRGAKAGTLWFFREGILWGESKPCEFWACEDLAGGGEAVRLISATGRTCSVYVKRRGRRAPAAAAAADGSGSGSGSAEGDAGGSDGDEEEGAETEFSMIDGREQEPISAWVRAHRHLFGRGPDAASADAEMADKEADKEADMANGHAPGYWGKVTLNNMPDDDEEDDESYKGNGSDGDSASSGSSLSSAPGSRSASASGSGSQDASGDDEVAGADPDGEGDLRMDDHPLLRPGAMPKRVSKAAMENIIDMMGGGGGSAGGRGGSDERARGAQQPPSYGMMSREAGAGMARDCPSLPATSGGPGGGRRMKHASRARGGRKHDVESEDDEVDELDD